MKKFLKKPLVAGVAAATLIAVALSLASYFYTGNAGPLANLVGIVVSPIQKGVNALRLEGQKIVDYFVRYDAIEAENQSLKEKIRDNEALIREAEIYKEENERLNMLLGISKENPTYEYEMAQIVSRDDAYSSVFTIDKGSSAGISYQNSVITEDGFVGFVSEVGTNWAKVTSVIDTSMSAGAVIEGGHTSAIAEGNFRLMQSGMFKLSYLSRDTPVLRGDLAFTSGMGGMFPKGLVLGKVEAVRIEPHGKSSYAEMRPMMDLNSLNYVFIIKAFS